ncbi:MAG TPA: protoglobin domain-containing protein [Anaerolineae bacterium]|nr:protoglobin domain-containing protein [Anaerolineae bacterium]
MGTLNELTNSILVQIPPAARFTPEDAQRIIDNQAALLTFEDAIVAGFYEALYSHGPTKAIFVEGERPDREETLRKWWRRTVSGPFDADYWGWQALVGLIHVKRKVKNVMMIGMWGWILTFLREAVTNEASVDDELLVSFERLAATVKALTAESYLEHYIKALQNATGFEAKLLERMVATEVDDLVQSVRGS